MQQNIFVKIFCYILIFSYKSPSDFIRENQDVAEYLCKDFFDDKEWYIPFNIKHYHTSRNVKINIAQGYKKDPNSIIFRDFFDTEGNYNLYQPPWTKERIEEHLLNKNYTIYEVFGQTLKTKNQIILPFEKYEEQFRQWKKINNKLDNSKKPYKNERNYVCPS